MTNPRISRRPVNLGLPRFVTLAYLHREPQPQRNVDRLKLRGADLALPSGRVLSATDILSRVPASAYDTSLREHLSRLLRACLSSLCAARGSAASIISCPTTREVVLPVAPFNPGFAGREIRCRRYVRPEQAHSRLRRPREAGTSRRQAADLPRCEPAGPGAMRRRLTPAARGAGPH